MTYPVQDLITELYKHMNESNAVPMAAYARNKFSYLGIKSPERSAIIKDFIKEYGKVSVDEWETVVRTLWALPEREFQYAACDVINGIIRNLEPEHVSFLDELVVSKSWWDTVDKIASNYIGVILLKTDSAFRKSYGMKALHSDNMWMQRTSLLFQLKYKEKLDTELLRHICLELSTSKEFFIQKAMGWLLREYSKTNPEWVTAFISGNELKPLTVREGCKYLDKKRF